MPYYVGTDEAGYGPNLGPLVVSTTVWHAAEPLGERSLYDVLAGAVVRSPRAASADRVAMADSKVLYNSGKGLHLLERGLLSALGTLGRTVESWQDAWTALDGCSRDARQAIPWYADYQCPAPMAVAPSEVERLAIALADAFDRSGARLVDVRSRAVFPAEFNDLCRRHASKGLALSHVTLDLLTETIGGLNGVARFQEEKRGRESFFASDCREPKDPWRIKTPDPFFPGIKKGHLDEQPIHVLCDKHGGRDRYADLLAEHFPEWMVETHGESRTRSTYRLEEKRGRESFLARDLFARNSGCRETTPDPFSPAGHIEIAFVAKGEAYLPAALASMASKYLRELAMHAFNAFWTARVEGLRPTAGYPVDAKRFKQEIDECQRAIGIDDDVLWRVK